MPSKPVAPPDPVTIGAQPRGAPRVRLIARTYPTLPQPHEMPGHESFLRDDIRLLGRLLGATLRHFEGEALFGAVEEIRQTATRFRRHGGQEDARLLDRLLKRLSPDDTMNVVRAFSYFSLLANIAEDLAQVRQLRQLDREGRAAARSIADTAQRFTARGLAPSRVRGVLVDADVMPVLTAHPTEVQRKSILDTERAIAAALGARDQASALGDRDGVAAAERGLATQVATLWLTRMLRSARLTVFDEIDNALAYWRSTFVPQMPSVYEELEERFDALAPAVVPAPGIVDRRRPRRPSARSRRDGAPRADCAGAGDVRALRAARCTRWAPSCRCRRC